MEAERRVAMAIALQERCERHAMIRASTSGAVDTLPRGSAICDPQDGRGRSDFQSRPRHFRPRRRGTGKYFVMLNRRTAPQLLRCTLVALALAACQPTVDQRGNLPDQRKLATIEPGVTTKEMVSQLLGTPSSVSTFGDK